MGVSLWAMAIIITFLLGIGNFALQRAVLDSGHPVLVQLPWFTAGLGARFTLAVEFALLVAALLLASEGATWGPITYVVYSMLNSFSAWLILTHRL